jgi:hypothetical protein
MCYRCFDANCHCSAGRLSVGQTDRGPSAAVVVRGGAYPEGEATMFDMKRRKTLLGVAAIAGPMARARNSPSTWGGLAW